MAKIPRKDRPHGFAMPGGGKHYGEAPVRRRFTSVVENDAFSRATREIDGTHSNITPEYREQLIERRFREIMQYHPKNRE